MVGLASTSTHQSPSVCRRLPRLAYYQNLVDLWVVLAHSGGLKYVMVVWESCETVPIPQSILQQAKVRMVGLASTSNHHSSSTSGPLRFDLCWKMANLWLVLAHGDSTERVMMVWECCRTVLLPQPSLQQPWVIMVVLASTSTHHSPSASGPIRFGLCWNAG